MDEFYKKAKNRSFLNKIARENKVDVILYSKFLKSKLKKVIRTRENPAKIGYQIYIYEAQNGAKQFASVTLEVNDLFTNPDYDPDEFSVILEKKYIELVQKIFGYMQIVGTAYKDDKSSKKNFSGSGANNAKTSKNKEETPEDDGGW